MNAKEALRRFSRGGGVIEGRGRMAALAVAAVMSAGAFAASPADAAPRHGGAAAMPTAAQVEKIVAKRYGGLAAMPDLPGMGILHGKDYPKYAGFRRSDDPGMPAPGERDDGLRNHSGKGITIDYEGMIRDIQAQVDAEFPGKILIVDRSKPVAEEAARVAAATGKPLAKNEMFVMQGDPHTSPGLGPKGPVCIVVGPKAELDLRDMTASFVEEFAGTRQALPFNGGPGLDDTFFARMMVWHEVGHCLAGGNEARADVFSVLKGFSEAKNRDFADFMVAMRELMERLSAPTDDHIISPAMRLAVAEYGNPGFWNKPHTLAELGRLADGIAVPIDAHTIFLRNTLAIARMAARRPGLDPRGVEFLVPVKEGFAVTDYLGWVKSASSIPEIGRIQELLDYLTGDPATRKVPAPFVENRESSKAAVTKLAQAGDPTARAIAWAFDAPDAAAADQPMPPAETLPSHAEIGGRLIAFDRSEEMTVQFGKDMQSFLLRDAATRKPVLSGTLEKGVVRSFADAHGHEHTASLAPGPR